MIQVQKSNFLLIFPYFLKEKYIKGLDYRIVSYLHK